MDSFFPDLRLILWGFWKWSLSHERKQWQMQSTIWWGGASEMLEIVELLLSCAPTNLSIFVGGGEEEFRNFPNWWFFFLLWRHKFSEKCNFFDFFFHLREIFLWIRRFATERNKGKVLWTSTTWWLESYFQGNFKWLTHIIKILMTHQPKNTLSWVFMRL